LVFIGFQHFRGFDASIGDKRKNAVLLKGCQKKTRNCREFIQDVQAWLIAALAAERITMTYLRRAPQTTTVTFAKVKQ